jgi:formiminoglutamase
MVPSELTARTECWVDKSQPGDPRVAGVVRPLAEGTDVRSGDLVLLGLCNDRGVQQNGGRAGAALGPLALRRALGRLSAGILGTRVLFDAGDLGAELSADYDRMFDLAESVLAPVFRRGGIAIVVGGGHDCAFATFRGLTAARLTPSVVNVDAHLDVRPTHEPSSGNPFYRMLEHGLADLTEVGLLGAINSAEHVAYARSRGATLSFLDPPATEQEQIAIAQEAMIRGRAHQRALHLSIDLDAIQAAHAPGVSWLNPVGLSPGTVRTLARMAGQYGARALDLMELAPPLDSGGENGRDGVTARLAALLIADFCAGLPSLRP